MGTGYATSLYTSPGSRSTPDLQENIHRSFKIGSHSSELSGTEPMNSPSCFHLIILFVVTLGSRPSLSPRYASDARACQNLRQEKWEHHTGPWSEQELQKTEGMLHFTKVDLLSQQRVRALWEPDNASTWIRCVARGAVPRLSTKVCLIDARRLECRFDEANASASGLFIESRMRHSNLRQSWFIPRAFLKSSTRGS